MNLADFFPDAELMADTYGLIGLGLTPSLSSDFFRLPDYGFVDYLNVKDEVLWWDDIAFMGIVAETPEEAVIVYVGTHTNLQWIKDIQARPRSWTTLDGVSGQVEHGFSDVYEATTLNKSAITLRQYIGQLNQKKKPLHVIGHSLGAAAGGIAAADSFSPRFSLFAMPKWGDVGLSRHLNSKARPGSSVIRNVQDVVPMAPPFPVYQSVLPELWFNSDMLGISGGDAARHSMQDCYLAACRG